MAKIEIDCVNLEGFVVLRSGEVLEITHYFDSDGDECDPEDAVACVAGNDDFGWLDVSIGEAADAPMLH